jgi:uroporphyrinogen decarboxylase
VWFMRQAGRSLPEYRAKRAAADVLEAVRDPELACELTLQPVRRYGVDGAIVFSDIVAPLAAIGLGVRVVPGRGPVLDAPFRTRADLARLRPIEPAVDMPWLGTAIRAVAEELASSDVAVIGFAGGPFTLASYLVEGGPSRDHVHTKTLMRTEPELFDELLGRLAALALASLRAQVEAGASVVQLFDSWVGALHPADYERHVLPHVRAVFDGLAGLGVPRIHFGVATGELLGLMAEAGADVVGVDWRVPLDVARHRVRRYVADRPLALQGNLDPSVCLAPFEVVEREALDVLRRGGGRGHVFNLGHGVLPETDPDTLKRLVALVRERSPAILAACASERAHPPEPEAR